MPVLAAPPPAPSVAGVYRPAISWTDPDGNVWDLSDLTVARGLIATTLQGIGAPPLAMTTIPLPSGDVVYQNLLPQPHQIVLGLYAENTQADSAAFHTLVSSITRAFYTVRRNAPAPGILAIGQQDGSVRQIRCYTVSGLDQAGTDYPLLQTQWTLNMQGDPFFTDQSAQTPVTWTLASEVGGLSGGSALVDNTGDADAYPIWSITGPGTPTVINSTTGLSFSFSAAVPAGATWTVVTAPDGGSSVTDQDGVSQWPQLVASAPRDMFPLIAGSNEISVQVVGASTATQVMMQYTRRWLRA